LRDFLLKKGANLLAVVLSKCEVKTGVGCAVVDAGRAEIGALVLKTLEFIRHS
jgi:hypothetical protein